MHRECLCCLPPPSWLCWEAAIAWLLWLWNGAVTDLRVSGSRQASPRRGTWGLQSSLLIDVGSCHKRRHRLLLHNRSLTALEGHQSLSPRCARPKPGCPDELIANELNIYEQANR